MDLDYSKLDAGIAPLVRLLNEAGYTTIGSCQGGVGHPRVTCSPSNRPGRAFVTVEGTGEDLTEKLDGLLKRHSYEGYNITLLKSNKCWVYGVYTIRFRGELSPGCDGCISPSEGERTGSIPVGDTYERTNHRGLES